MLSKVQKTLENLNKLSQQENLLLIEVNEIKLGELIEEGNKLVKEIPIYVKSSEELELKDIEEELKKELETQVTTFTTKVETFNKGLIELNKESKNEQENLVTFSSAPIPALKPIDEPKIEEIKDDILDDIKPKKGWLTSYRENRHYKYLSRDIEKLYIKKIEELETHIQNDKNAEILKKADALTTVKNLIDILEAYIRLLSEKSGQDKKEIDSIKKLIERLNTIEKSIKAIIKSDYYGKKYAEEFTLEEDGIQVVRDITVLKDQYPQVIASITNNNSTDKSKKYCIENTIKNNNNAVSTLTVPEENDGKFTHKIYCNNLKALKEATEKKLETRKGLYKVSVPNKETMTWAAAQIENYLKNAKNKKDPIYINVVDLSDNMLLALQLYCKSKNYPAIVNPPSLDKLKGKNYFAIKRQIAVIEDMDPLGFKEIKPDRKFEKSIKHSQEIAQHYPAPKPK